MTSKDMKAVFLQAADAWLCDGYSADVRYIAGLGDDHLRIWDASISLNPLPPTRDNNLSLSASHFAVGLSQQVSLKKPQLTQILANAVLGRIDMAGHDLRLANCEPLSYHSEMLQRDRWFSELHLQVVSPQFLQPAPVELVATDSALRLCQPPFDGLADVASWLGLKSPVDTSSSPAITIRVGPPADIIFEGCSLTQDQLTLTLHAHPGFDVGRVGLAVRAIPGDALKARKQIANKIEWGLAQDGRRPGKVCIELEQADSALVMLLIEQSTVRRQWFIDPLKARNNRLLACQHFDADLRMAKDAVLEAADSGRFEQGVAALLFLLGFSPSAQIEKDAPDLILMTPGGRMALVECTTRIADFASKLGKLVDRRGSLMKYLSASGHPAQLAALLVCRLPRDQIVAHSAELSSRQVSLLTREDLVTCFEQLRGPSDPDKLFESVIESPRR